MKPIYRIVHMGTGLFLGGLQHLEIFSFHDVGGFCFDSAEDAFDFIILHKTALGELVGCVTPRRFIFFDTNLILATI